MWRSHSGKGLSPSLSADSRHEAIQTHQDSVFLKVFAAPCPTRDRTATASPVWPRARKTLREGLKVLAKKFYFSLSSGTTKPLIKRGEWHPFVPRQVQVDRIIRR